MTSRDRKAEMSLYFRNSTWKSGFPLQRADYKPVAEEDFQDGTGVKSLS